MIAANQQPAFEFANVGVTFGNTPALSNLSLRVNRGECVGIVGPSGAGKTTLLRLLNGAVRPTSGDVRVNGRNLRNLAPRELRQLRASLGFIHQQHCLVPNLRVLQNVLSGKLGQQSLLRSLWSMLLPSNAEAVEVHRLLERVGIAEKLYERADRLSGGQQQRVAIARALYQQPIALLADEPVASIDPARARAVIALLTDIAAESNLTLLVSLHNLELAREFFPRLIGLRNGRVAFDEATDKLTETRFNELYELASEQLLEDAVEA